MGLFDRRPIVVQSAPPGSKQIVQQQNVNQDGSQQIVPVAIGGR